MCAAARCQRKLVKLGLDARSPLRDRRLGFDATARQTDIGDVDRLILEPINELQHEPHTSAREDFGANSSTKFVSTKPGFMVEAVVLLLGANPV